MTLKLDKEITKYEKKLLDKAKAFSLDNNLEEVLKVLQELVGLDSSCGQYHAMMGNTLWDLNKLEEAEHSLFKAVSLLPLSEPVSRNLFHVLWDQKKSIEALDEVKRFTKLTGSNTYDEIIEEINNT